MPTEFKQDDSNSLEPGETRQALHTEFENLRHVSLLDLFEKDKERAFAFSMTAGPVFCDYSKNHITESALKTLLKYARACGLEEWREKLFSGDIVNDSENRPATHTHLRDPGAPDHLRPPLKAMRAFYDKLDADQDITDIIHIGIGGSDIGPAMVCRALKHANTARFRIHFLSNIDPASLLNLLDRCSPENTLAIVSSKSFSTKETMKNAQGVWEWFQSAKDIKKPETHMVCITANPDKARETFNIGNNNILTFPESVGGRFSLWSAIGLPIMLAVGPDAFEDLLKGAYECDKHFLNAPLEQNLPVILALLTYWQRNIGGIGTRAILPYTSALEKLPCYLQQLSMESNGKHIKRDGSSLDGLSAPVVFGHVGTDGQHTFFQHLHQGTDPIACEFIALAKSPRPYQDHHTVLSANAIAQAEALMLGRNDPDNPHLSCPGNRPSIFLLLQDLSPYSLGYLLALFEHRIFTESVLWGVNCFDQFGVELGKAMAGDVEIALNKGKNKGLDASTKSIIEKFIDWA